MKIDREGRPARDVADARPTKMRIVLLVLLLAPIGMMGLGGLIVQATTDLPFTYTWLRPFNLLQGALSRPGVPTALVLALALGWWTRVGHLRVAVIGLHPTVSPLVWGLRFAIGGLVICTLALVGSVSHVLDLIVLLVAVAVLAGQSLRKQGVVVALVESTVIVIGMAIVCYVFTVSKSLVLRGVDPWDDAILVLERQVFGMTAHEVVSAWVRSSPAWLFLLDDVYFRIFEHMVVVSIFLVGVGSRQARLRYLVGLAFCYLIGGISYHLFPAWGPVYWQPSMYSFLADGPPTTVGVQAKILANTRAAIDGRLSVLTSFSFVAAVPSLHFAHEVVMIVHSRRHPLMFAASLVFGVLTLGAVLGLGWHYLSDVVAGAGLAVGSMAMAWALVAGVERLSAELVSRVSETPSDASSMVGAAGDAEST